MSLKKFLLLITVLVSVGCSENSSPAPFTADGNLIQEQGLGADAGLDGRRDGLLGLDISLRADQTSDIPFCQPGAALLSKVNPSRMLLDLTFLSGLKERKTIEGQTKAAEYLKTELAGLAGIKLWEQRYQYQGTWYTNLEVTIEGQTQPANVIMAGAHYDSASNDPERAPGADDNASGTVAVLEAARVLAKCKPKQSIRLVFFSNEEQGTIGSQAYVKAIKPSISSSQLKGFISVDMVGYGSASEDLDLATKPAYEGLADTMKDATERWTQLKAKKVIQEHCG